MIRIQRNMLLGLSGFKDRLLKPNLCKDILLVGYILYSEIERKKEEGLPKRGDFFHVKVFRKDDNDQF